MRIGDKIGTATVASVAGEKPRGFLPHPLPCPRGPASDYDEPLIARPVEDEHDTPFVCVTVHVKTTNPLNTRRHWLTVNREAETVKSSTALALSGVLPATWRELAAGCLVKLTRVSVGTLDDDNLPATLKHVRDVVAVHLFGGEIGQRDGDKRATWIYSQLKATMGVYGVIVSIAKRGRDES